ncbi:MAG TPA: hypothetical protein VGE40_03725, partial [Bacilli bacterium]
MNHRNKSPILRIIGIIGALTFLIINWWPLFSGGEAEPSFQSTPSLTKEQARQTALSYTASLCRSCILESFVMYQSNQELSAYLQKNHLVEAYNNSFATEVPVDYFQVDLVDKTSEKHYFVDVHPNNMKVIGWQLPNSKLVHKQQGKEQGKVYHIDEQIQMAHATMKEMAYAPDQFYLTEDVPPQAKPEKDSSRLLVFTHKNKSIGEARLQLHVSVSGGVITAFHPILSNPKDHELWLQEQDASAALMS